MAKYHNKPQIRLARDSESLKQRRVAGLVCTSLYRPHFWTACFTVMLFSSGAVAQLVNPPGVQSNRVEDKRKAHTKTKTGPIQATSVVSKTRASVAPTVRHSWEAPSLLDAVLLDAKSPISPGHLDKVGRLKGWNIPFPSFAETTLQDYGGWRSTMAQYGFSFLAYNLTVSATNVLNTPLTRNGVQQYWGQRGSIENVSAAFLNYDLSQYGIPSGQLQFAGNILHSSWQPYFPSANSIQRLAYYQTLFDGKLEINAGYLSNTTTFVGIYIGGQLQNTFGPSASIPTELGLSVSPQPQPTFWVKYNFDSFYTQAGVARSLAPTSTTVLSDQHVNPTGIRFSEPGAKALYIDEIGYRRAAAPGLEQMWLRAGAIYNTSDYHNLATGGLSTNSGAYLLADRQLFQVDPSTPETAYRGLYLGGSAMYADPTINTFTQYYEARLYAVGYFDWRPRDTISLIYNHNVISPFLVRSTNLRALTTGTYATYGTNTITASYSANLVKGVFLNLGLSYTDKPSVTYTLNEGHALNFLVSTMVYF